MGSKRPGQGQPFLLYLACWVMPAFMSAGCLHMSGTRQGQAHLATARHLLAGGDYAGALEKNHKVLEDAGTDLVDQALFQIGLIYAHPENPDRNYLKSLEAFQRIVHQFPESSLGPDARIWSLVIEGIIDSENQIQQLTENNAALDRQLRLQKEKISRLQDQLEKLKNIDIKIEEKKRRVLPPPEETGEKANGKDSDN
jgi:tetratricopeptide (TPR) repeat protein